MTNAFENTTAPTHPGARWWKVDFHAHSPASFDFGALEGRRATTTTSYRDWLLAYMKSGIDAIIIADHNSHDGIDKARHELILMQEEGIEEFRELYIFAGVEITVEGGHHLLAVFDVDTDSDKVNGLLHRCGYTGTRGESTATTSKAFAEVVNEITEAGGLAIPAHADKSKGLFQHDLRNQDAIRDAGKVLAVEVVTDEGVAKAKEQGWVSVLGSDAHFLNGDEAPAGVEAKFPGSHFTWIKMETPNLLGIKLALSDEDSSVLRSAQANGDPGDYRHHVIDRVVVEKDGFESDYGFGPWMNSIIGGRGVGKSTVVELVRLAMGRHDDLPAGLRGSGEWFAPWRGKGENARFWDQHTKIEVHISKLGREYRVVWRGESPDEGKVEAFVDGAWVQEAGSPRERFPLMINSQKQIFETASDPQSLLKIIDDQQAVDYAGWKEGYDALKSKYRTQRASMAELKTQIDSESRLKGELADAKAELKLVAKVRDSAEAKELDDLVAHERRAEQKRARATSMERALANIVQEFNEFEIGDPSEPPAKEAEADVFTSPEEEAHIASAGSAYQEVKDLFKKLSEARAAREAVSAQAPRKERIRTLELQLSDAQSGSDHASDETHEDLNQAHARLSKIESDRLTSLEQISDSKKRLEGLEGDAGETLSELASLRGELTRRRSEVVQTLSNDELKLTVLAQADTSSLEGDLRALVQKSTAFDTVFGENGLPSVLGHPFQPRRDERVSKLKMLLKDLRLSGSDTEGLGDAGLSFDQRFYSHLDNLDQHSFETEIDLWFPEDLLRVQYRRSTAGRFQEINQGSPGEKTAALLAVILQLSNDPLLLDQPEDDLDNKLIYDLVVATLKKIKTGRQIIVVTHNANVVVNADSEHVTILKHGLVPAVEAQGSIQRPDIKESICLIMEGGESAFEARYQRLMRG